MNCPNPACGRDLFKVRVMRKETIKGIPMLPVELICAHCEHKIKVWVTNQNLKDIESYLDDILKKLKSITEISEEIRERTKRKGFLDGFLKRFKRGDER